MAASSVFRYSNRRHRIPAECLCSCTVCTAESEGSHSSLCRPQPLAGAYCKHPAGVGTGFTPCNLVSLRNSVRLESLRCVRQQIWGDFFLNMPPLQLPNCNAKDWCNFICCLSCWIPRKFISLPLTNPKGTCNPMISDYLSETLSTEICATLLCT